MNQGKRVKVDTSCDTQKKEESVGSLGTASENTEPVIVSKEEASKKAMVSGASGMNFGGNGCNFTIKITFGQ